VVAWELPADPVLPSARSSGLPTLEAVVVETDAGDGVRMPRVALWGFAEEAREKLVAALWLHKLHAVPWLHGELPPGQLTGHPIQVILMPGNQHAIDRISRLRAEPTHRKTPVLVTDIADATEVIPLIRAGASDMTLAGTSDEPLCNQVVRLVRRGR
jgi:DNA-binding NarL/FixJ family response regulator